jgi:hypothetical protein
MTQILREGRIKSKIAAGQLWKKEAAETKAEILRISTEINVARLG